MIIPDASRLNSFICDSFSLYVKTHISDKLRFSFELDIFICFLYHYRKFKILICLMVFHCYSMHREYRTHKISKMDLQFWAILAVRAVSENFFNFAVYHTQYVLPTINQPDIINAPLSDLIILRFKCKLPITA